MKKQKKETRITVRLTPNQDFMLDEISSKINKSKSAVIRYLINNLVKQYDNATNE